MHQNIHNAFDALDAARAELTAAVEAVPDADRTLVPADGGWSANDVLAHLLVVERRIAGVLAAAIAAARSTGLGAETSTDPATTTLNLDQLRDRSRKIQAGEASLPPSSSEFAPTWSELAEVRERLKAAVADADGLALSTVTTPHPRLGPMNVYQWLYFVAGHESRHGGQIRAIRS